MTANRRLIDLLDYQYKADTLATDLAKASRDHGPRHWRDVARIGLALGKAENLNAELLAAVFAFAAIHDTQRQSEFSDPMHGQRAADAMLAIATDQHQVVLGEHRDRLYRALVDHDKGDVYRLDDPDITFADRLIATCWDADRLTLDRVGIEPLVQYMSTGSVRGDFATWLRYGNAIVFGPDMGWDEIATKYSQV